MPPTDAYSEAELIEQIRKLVARIQAKTEELERSISNKIGWLLGYLADRVREGWNQFTNLMRQMWDALSEIFSNLGSPTVLWDTADAWSNSVGGPVSGQVQSADPGSLAVDSDHWAGSGATRYREILPLQKTALDKVKSTYTDGISSALSDLAKGIIAFWGALITALASLVGGIIGALASSATIFGLPAAPFIAGAAALVACGAFYAGGMILKAVASSANTTLRQKINDNSGYRDPSGGTAGHWPPATTTG